MWSSTLPPSIALLPVIDAGRSASHCGEHRLGLDLDPPARVEQPVTIAVDAGRISANTSPCARAISSQSAGVDDEHPRADDVGEGRAACSSASPTSSRQSRICSYAPSGGSPSLGIGAVPATWTVRPATTARENPATELVGRVPRMRRRSIRLVSRAVESLRQIESWPVEHAAAGVATAGRVVGRARRHGPQLRLGLRDEARSSPTRRSSPRRRGRSTSTSPPGREGSTVRHLLAHASGLAWDSPTPLSRPGERRIYSNSGFVALAAHVEARAEMPFATYLHEAVLVPLALGATFDGDAAAGLTGTLADVLRFGRELLAPTLVAPETLAEATSVQFPGLDGVLPGFGRQTRTTGASASSSATRSRRTGPARSTRRRRSAISARSRARRRSSGSIPSGARVRRAGRRVVRRLGAGGLAALADAVLSAGSPAAAG